MPKVVLSVLLKARVSPVTLPALSVTVAELRAALSRSVRASAGLRTVGAAFSV